MTTVELTYHIPINNGEYYEDLTEAEFFACFGDEIVRPYASKVYKDQLTLEEVPEDIRQTVAAVVQNRVARWGKYDERELSASETLSIILGGGY